MPSHTSTNSPEYFLFFHKQQQWDGCARPRFQITDHYGFSANFSGQMNRHRVRSRLSRALIWRKKNRNDHSRWLRMAACVSFCHHRSCYQCRLLLVSFFCAIRTHNPKQWRTLSLINKKPFFFSLADKESPHRVLLHWNISCCFFFCCYLII